MRASSELHFGALREVAARERQGAVYAPDSAKAEGSLIVDEPGEC